MERARRLKLDLVKEVCGGGGGGELLVMTGNKSVCVCVISNSLLVIIECGACCPAVNLLRSPANKVAAA